MDLRVTLSLLLKCQELNLDLCRVLADDIAQQRRRINYLHQIIAGPIRRRRGIRGRLWIRPRRTSQWWDNFVNGSVDALAWKENFRTSKTL